MATSTDLYLLQPLEISTRNGVSVARLVRVCRLARICRVLRVLRFARNLLQLRVMTLAMSKCMSPLIWSLLILTLVIVGSGIFVSQCVLDFIRDDSASMMDRRWVFRYYGSASRACYTMFEVTFSGSWPGLTRPLVDLVHGSFAIFIILYQIAIAFACMRIIGAIFLNETLKAASGDAEMEVMERMKKKDTFAEKLRNFFKAADTSGDGALSLDEIEEALEDPGVSAWLKALELEIYEVVALFRLLDDNEDGTVSYEEFLAGAVRLKGNARAIDSILIMHEQHRIDAHVSKLTQSVDEVRVHLEMPAAASRPNTCKNRDSMGS